MRTADRLDDLSASSSTRRCIHGPDIDLTQAFAVDASFGAQPVEEGPDLLVAQVIARADDPLRHEPIAGGGCADRADKRPAASSRSIIMRALQRDSHAVDGRVDRHVASVEENPAPSLPRLYARPA